MQIIFCFQWNIGFKFQKSKNWKCSWIDDEGSILLLIIIDSIDDNNVNKWFFSVRWPLPFFFVYEKKCIRW